MLDKKSKPAPFELAPLKPNQLKKFFGLARTEKDTTWLSNGFVGLNKKYIHDKKQLQTLVQTVDLCTLHVVKEETIVLMVNNLKAKPSKYSGVILGTYNNILTGIETEKVAVLVEEPALVFYYKTNFDIIKTLIPTATQIKVCMPEKYLLFYTNENNLCAICVPVILAESEIPLNIKQAQNLAKNKTYDLNYKKTGFGFI